MTIPPLPDDPAALQALIETQQAEIDHLQETSSQQSETIDSQHEQIEKLRHELQLFRRYLYGQRRERFVDDARQQKLFEICDDGSESEPDTTAESADQPASPPRRRGRRPLPEFLPRKTCTHELQGDQLLCPCCGKPRVKVSEKTSEQLEFEPASLYVKRHVRYVDACQEADCQANMQTAEKPPQPIEKGLAGPGLLAFVIASKLADHLPLNRLEDILTRHGVHIARSTQCDWMAACATLAEPLYRLILQRTLQSDVLGTDDTPVPIQDSELERTRTGRFWAHFGDDRHPYVCYDFTPNRSRDGPQKFLKDFQGFLQADAYAGYIELARNSGGTIRHVGCWAHARRYFDRARERGPSRAVHEGLAFIQRLYDVEHQAEEMPADQRLALRRDKSIPILREFRVWLDRQDAVPSSPLAEAITYTVNQWESLNLYVQDGRIPIDNNRTEATVRQQVVGRNNWLFLGSEKGGHTAAVLYTLVVSCKRLRIDPYAYLRDVLTRLPTITGNDLLAELLPDHWIARHPEHRLEHREREASQAKARRKDRRARRKQLARARSKTKPK